MIKITLESADNGLIKTVIDNNINGAGERFESRTVYDLDLNDNRHSQTIRFFYELCEDLGIDTGNKFSKHTLILKTDWGGSYTPSLKELKQKIAILNSDLEKRKIEHNQLTKN